MLPHQQAKERVINSPVLEPYFDALMASWPSAIEHWEFVNTATEDELVEWSQIQNNLGFVRHRVPSRKTFFAA